jgi:hypothetical protein
MILLVFCVKTFFDLLKIPEKFFDKIDAKLRI